MSVQKYYALLTKAGQAAMLRSVTLNEPVRLTDMAVGDGNGADIIPTEEMTALVNEVHRAPINSLEPEPDQPDLLVADMIIPHEVGGWTVSELGIYDAEGNLFAVANVPATYKPKMVDGSSTELRFRMLIAVRNADRIELIIDPTVILATRDYVAQELAGHGNDLDAHPAMRDHMQNMDDPHNTLPNGGTAGQLLTKQADSSVVWQTLDQSALTAHAARTDDPHNTLPNVGTAGQVLTMQADASVAWNTIDLSVLNAHIARQDDPHNTLPNGGNAGQMLAKKADGSLEWTDSTPLGIVSAFTGTVPPQGWLFCDGALLSRTTYSQLFATIGATYGSTDGTNFRLPDLRGEFIRGWDNGRGVDLGRGFGSWQEDNYKSHIHSILGSNSDHGDHNDEAISFRISTMSKRTNQYRSSLGSKVIMTGAGGTETRPRNVALHYCIRAY